MSAIVDPNGPKLVGLPTNPIPSGARAGYFVTEDKVRLRYATWPKGQGKPRGTVCIAQGRGEFIEKYFETIADFQSRGFAVATFDWRGQGGSDRLIANKNLGYVGHFDDYWTDLKSFHTQILLPDCPGPYYLVGHSMGGLVSLNASTRDRMMFDRIFLSAPMLKLDRQPFDMKGMSRLTGALCLLGLGKLPIARRSDKAPSDASFAGNGLTSDLLRYMRMVDTVKAAPALEIGAPTIRWAASATSAMARAAHDDFPAKIRIPVLMLAAARDTVVSPSAIEYLGLHMRTGHHLMIAAARHELFMENDTIRGQVLAAFDAFITDQSS